MPIPERDSLLAAYEADVAHAFSDLLVAFRAMLDEEEGDMRSHAGRCGARLAAAHKRCKRGLIFSVLAQAQDHGLDITPTVAEHLCARLIGRGVDFSAALEKFGTPGRTAANKSRTTEADLHGFEEALYPEIMGLVAAMAEIRQRYKDEYESAVSAG